MKRILPAGKLSPAILKKIIDKAPILDSRVLLGPGIGLDCAVIDNGDKYLILKTDPITFATDDIGWYAVQINVNDIVTTGATPLWMTATTLFPEGLTDESMVDKVCSGLFDACRQMNISMVNAHTEITHGIDRPLMICSLVGEVAKDRLITPQGAKPGNAIMLTKGVPIEGSALLAKEFSQRAAQVLSHEELEKAKNFTHTPGIGISLDAMVATKAGRVTAMHDPTEGGIASALWEISEASGLEFSIDSRLIPICKISRKLCAHFNLNPLNTISSGALLLTAEAEDAPKIIQALSDNKIPCAVIGSVTENKTINVMDVKTGLPLFRPEQDEIGKIFG